MHGQQNIKSPILGNIL